MHMGIIMDEAMNPILEFFMVFDKLMELSNCIRKFHIQSLPK
jgi:hypothetical protein